MWLYDIGAVLNDFYILYVLNMIELNKNEFYVITFIILHLILECCADSNVSYIDDLYLNEVRSLSELPLGKLVQLKSSFIKKGNNIQNKVTTYVVKEHLLIAT